MADTRIQYLKSADIRRYLYTTYTQGSVSAFGTQFLTDWASVLPNGGQGLGVVAKPGASTVAEVIVAPGQVLEVNVGDAIGFNYSSWAVIPAAALGRTVADGATNTNTTVTSATAAFNNPLDNNAIIAGPGIPSGTTISSVTNGTTVVISQAATATATNQPLTITRTTSTITPDIV